MFILLYNVVRKGEKMVLKKDAYGHITYYKFYRKHYRKARYLRWAERQKKSLDRDDPGWYGLIIW